ncbi:MAG TPA: aspartate aminotransferase family protein [Vicinamibacterales bacterium]|nr:aspartate aminotransferase family protein [Vicinamibacterales bacterium]
MNPLSDLLARDAASLIHPLHDRNAHRAGHVWVRGHGALLVDADGKEYIDGLAGLWNVVLGHGRRELAEAAGEQLETLAYASGYCGSSNMRAIELAERLARLTYPAINRFFFTSGGAEANESAIKMARSYWKLRGRPAKTKVISRELGYHGVTLAAMSATGIAGYWPLFEPRVPGFIHVPSPYPYRAGTANRATYGVTVANELEKAILREGAETVAMFLAEPVIGVGGVIVPPDDYFPRIREICDTHDVLFAADEVITGFGRAGRWFALEHWGVVPDIVQFAKGITSGYFPLGGIGVSDDIARVLDEAPGPWMHAYTYSAHPVGCAVALRTIQIIEEENLVAEAARKGTYLMDVLRARLSHHPHVGEIRGTGLMCAVEFVKDRDTKMPFAPEEQVGSRIHNEARARGLFSRVRGDVFVLAPPFVTPDDLLDRIAEILASATTAVLG